MDIGTEGHLSSKSWARWRFYNTDEVVIGLDANLLYFDSYPKLYLIGELLLRSNSEYFLGISTKTDFVPTIPAVYWSHYASPSNNKNNCSSHIVIQLYGGYRWCPRRSLCWPHHNKSQNCNQLNKSCLLQIYTNQLAKGQGLIDTSFPS